MSLKDIDPNKEYLYSELAVYVEARDEGLCILCGHQGGQMHHVKYRSQGGKNIANNLAWICYPCHDTIHNKVDKVASLLFERIRENEKRFRENLI